MRKLIGGGGQPAEDAAISEKAERCLLRRTERELFGGGRISHKIWLVRRLIMQYLRKFDH